MFFREYIRVLVILLVAMGAYAFTLNLWVEPAKNTYQRPKSEFVSQSNDSAWWNDLFEVDDWRHQSPLRLETPRADLLFKSFENVGTRRYKAVPLTILVPQFDDSQLALPIGERRPTSVLVIDNPNGAEIQFAAELDLTNNETPPPSNIQMLGAVTIKSIDLSGKEGTPGFELSTSQLKIDGNRISSAQDLLLRFGASYIEGHDFSLSMRYDIFNGDQVGDKSNGPFSSFDSLNVYYVDRVDIDLPNAGLLESQLRQKYQNQQELPHATMKLSCKGSFDFDFQRMIASVHDEVTLQHIVPGFQPDQFDCTKLELLFRYASIADVNGSNSNQTEPLGASIRVEDGQLVLKSMEAFGTNTPNANDVTRWMNVAAPNLDIQCKARWIHVLPEERKIAMANRLPTDTTIEASPVHLQRSQINLWTPKAEFKYTQPSSDTVAAGTQHLGVLWAEGPGEASVVTDDNETWNVAWANALTMQPNGTEDLITVDGSAQVRSDRQGRFTAEKILLWLTQVQRGDENRILPMRLQATDKVIANTPAMRGEVNQLRLWFTHPNEAMSPSASTSLTRISQPTPEQQLVSNGLPLSQPSVSLANSRVNSEVMPTVQPTAKSITIPTVVTGASLDAKLYCEPGQEPVLEDLQLFGDVTMTRKRLSETLDMPVTITGAGVKMKGGSNEDAVIEITGEPAVVQIGNGNLVGRHIHFDQQKQLFYVPEAGEMTIPPELIAPPPDQLSTDSRFENPALQAPPLMNPTSPTVTSSEIWIEPPRVRWSGQMTFDGQLMTMNQGVTIEGRYQSDHETLWHLGTQCDEMRVELTKSAFIRGQPGDEANVSTVQMLNNVDIKAVNTNLAGDRRSLEHLQVPTLTILPQTQTMIGAGKGSLRSRRFNRNTKLNQSSAFDASGMEQELQCVHLTFFGQMDGNYAEQRVTFRDNVAAVVGPIINWEDELNVDRINTLASGQTKLESDVLSVYSTRSLPSVRDMEARFPGSSKAAWELTAQGNLVVNSNTERGVMAVRANEGRYSALTEVLKIAGTANRPAEIIKAASANDPNTIQGTLTEGLYNIRTGEMQANIQMITGSPPPGYNRNQPPSAPNMSPGGAVVSPTAPQIQSPREFNPFAVGK